MEVDPDPRVSLGTESDTGHTGGGRAGTHPLDIDSAFPTPD